MSRNVGVTLDALDKHLPMQRPTFGGIGEAIDCANPKLQDSHRLLTEARHLTEKNFVALTFGNIFLDTPRLDQTPLFYWTLQR